MTDARGRDVRRRRGRPQGAPPQRAAAVHHREAAAGGGEPARLHREEDDDARAAALRGRRARRRGRSRRSSRTCAPTPSVSPTEAVDAVRGYIAERVRQGPPARGAGRLQDARRSRAGRPRGDPPDVARVRRRSACAPFFEQMASGHVPALRAHLEPLRRLPDGAGGLRPDDGGHLRRPRHVPRHRLILKFPGYLAVYGAKPPEEEAGARRRRRRTATRGANEERQLPAARRGRGARARASSSPSSTSPSRRRASTRPRS